MTLAIARTVAAIQDHLVRDRTAYDSHLSDFVCSCGQVFRASSALSEPPRDYPSMSMVHRAEVVSLALGIEPTSRHILTTARQLHTLDDFTVIRDNSGLMLRLHRAYTGGARWFAQDGRILDVREIAMPATILWQPGDQD